jgi:hypothetical protein
MSRSPGRKRPGMRPRLIAMPGGNPPVPSSASSASGLYPEDAIAITHRVASTLGPAVGLNGQGRGVGCRAATRFDGASGRIPEYELSSTRVTREADPGSRTGLCHPDPTAALC